MDPVSLHAGVLLSETLRAAGKADEGVKTLTRLRALYPNNVNLYTALVDCYATLNDYPSARRALEDGLRSNPGDKDLRASAAVLYALEGKREEALEAARELSAEGGTAGWNAKLFVNAVLGDFDGAFTALDELAKIHAWPFLVKTEPLLGGLQKDPRFADFCRKVGIPT